MFNSDRRLRKQESDTAPVAAMSEDDMPLTDEVVVTTQAWPKPATIPHTSQSAAPDVLSYAPQPDGSSQTPLGPYEISLSHPSVATPSRPLSSSHPGLHTPGSVDEGSFINS